MSEVDAFLASVIAQQVEPDTALHNGDGEWKIVHRHGDPRPEDVDAGIHVAIAMYEHPTRAI